MGIVQRQSIKQSAVTYLGMLIGAANLFFVYPLCFSTDQIGIIQFVLGAVTFFMPIALLGSHIVAIQFFPRFRDEATGNHGFLGVLLVLAATSCVTLLCAIYFFQETIAAYYGGRSEYFIPYLPYIMPLIALMSFGYICTVYASNFQRIVVPSIYYNLLSKVTAPLLALAFWAGLIGFGGVFDGFLITYAFIAIGLWVYLRHLGQASVRINTFFLTPDLRRDLRQYFLYNAVFGIGFTVINKLDALMVGTMIDLKSVAIFSLAYFLSEAIDTPRKAIFSIVSPLVAGSMQRGDMVHILELYRKSAINALIAGLYLLLGIWVCTDGLFAIMPKGAEFAAGKWVILILGLGRITDMVASLNYEIINFSRYYRFHFWAVIFMAIVTIGLNLLLIPIYSFYGAALATLISLVFYNLLKGGFIWYRFKIQPITSNTLRALALAATLGIGFHFIPPLPHPVFDILFRGALMTVLFGGLTYALRLSDEFNTLLKSLISKYLYK